MAVRLPQCHSGQFSMVRNISFEVSKLTLFKYQGTWGRMSSMIIEEPEQREKKIERNWRKDAKALFFIQQAGHETNFSRITSSNTSLEAW